MENPTLRRLSVGVSLVQKPDPAKPDRGTGLERRWSDGLEAHPTERKGDGEETGWKPIPPREKEMEKRRAGSPSHEKEEMKRRQAGRLSHRGEGRER
ncbi:MAG TPA: hypothetical protein ENK11_09505 [Phycisphaerales bacterium]|nr:hypothetical protein [Phycisphaerales bacterium]